MDDWKELSSTLDILPYGLTSDEQQVLNILADRGECSLQMLSAATGLSRPAIQKDVEVHLLKEGLMKIDGKRDITVKGRKTLDEIALGF